MDSDYDLMVIVSASDKPRYERAQEAYASLHGLGIPLDVLVYTRDEFDWQLPAATSLPVAAFMHFY